MSNFSTLNPQLYPTIQIDDISSRSKLSTVVFYCPEAAVSVNFLGLCQQYKIKFSEKAHEFANQWLDVLEGLRSAKTVTDILNATDVISDIETNIALDANVWFISALIRRVMHEIITLWEKIDPEHMKGKEMKHVLVYDAIALRRKTGTFDRLNELADEMVKRQISKMELASSASSVHVLSEEKKEIFHQDKVEVAKDKFVAELTAKDIDTMNLALAQQFEYDSDDSSVYGANESDSD